MANLVFALFWRHLHGWRLGALVVAALLGFIATERHYHDFNLGFEWANVHGGLARVMFSFFVGVGVARYQTRHPSKVRVPSIILLAILASALSLPLSGQLRQVQQIGCVTILFPAIIYLGASATEHRPELGAVLGDASYAMYVLHWPALIIVTLFLSMFGVIATGLLVQLSLTFAILMGALIAHRRYDTPVRRRIRPATP